jgi:riboflavin kinase/FMN adenylyltransferase
VTEAQGPDRLALAEAQVTPSATFPVRFGGSVIAIGNFDGVHLGHQALMQQAAAIAAKKNAAIGVLTFEPHPRAFFSADARGFRIASSDTKCELLAGIGLDYVVVEPFTSDLSQCSPEEFVREYLVRRLRVGHVVVGEDYRFGKRRAGDVALLRRLGARFGFGVTAIEKKATGDACVSSTRIRALIQAGEIQEAGRLLGRTWQVRGRLFPSLEDGGRIVIVDDAHYVRPSSGSYTIGVAEVGERSSARHLASATVSASSNDEFRMIIRGSATAVLTATHVDIAFHDSLALPVSQLAA